MAAAAEEEEARRKEGEEERERRLMQCNLRVIPAGGTEPSRTGLGW